MTYDELDKSQKRGEYVPPMKAMTAAFDADNKPASILGSVRAEGFRDGFGQASLLSHDEAFYNGQQDAWAEAPSRLRWFLFGAAVTAPIVWWLA